MKGERISALYRVKLLSPLIVWDQERFPVSSLWGHGVEWGRLSPRKLKSFLEGAGKLDDFVRYFSQRNNQYKILADYATGLFSGVKPQDICRYIYANKIEANGLKAIRTITKIDNDTLLLPGSSLKGALRNAMAYSMMNATLKPKYEGFIKYTRDLNKVVSELHDRFDPMVAEMFRGYRTEEEQHLSEEDARKKNQDESTRLLSDLFRSVIVSDLPVPLQANLGIGSLKLVKAASGQAPKGTIDTEAVFNPATTSFPAYLEITIDPIFAQKPERKRSLFSHPREVLKDSQAFFKDLWEFEKNFFYSNRHNLKIVGKQAPGLYFSFYETPCDLGAEDGKDRYLVRFGAGCGVMGKSLALALQRAERTRLLQAITIKTRRLDHYQYNNAPAPKTRWLLDLNGQLYPPGWCVLEQIDG